MRLHDVGERTEAGRRVLHASVTWEDQDREPRELRVEVPADAALPATVSPAVFLPVAAVAAHVHGETRMRVEGSVDMTLLAGIVDALTWFSTSDPSRRAPLVIDADARAEPAPAGSRTMALLTGGVDSTAALIDNHARYDPTHPHRTSVGLVVFGLDESTDGDIHRPDDFLESLCDRFGLDLIAIRTNVRVLDPSVRFWWDHAQTATWSGIAHAFEPDVRELIVGADAKIGDDASQHRGSHPILDNWFASSNVRIHHGAGRLSRLERLELVTASGPALASLQVCNGPRRSWRPLNCGRCEKCQRTMLALVALGALDRASSFPVGELTPETVSAIQLGSWTLRSSYETLLPLLESRGRTDLAVATRQMLRRSRLLALKAYAKRTEHRLARTLRR
ncbi:MAG: hypothetical protein U5K30_08050 [Acidimicrobiales bacterium]|nr:hypothetical protein [Acidimicrobiales bacterium]